MTRAERRDWAERRYDGPIPEEVLRWIDAAPLPPVQQGPVVHAEPKPIPREAWDRASERLEQRMAEYEQEMRAAVFGSGS